MVGRLIQNQYIGTGNHHLRQHTTHLLTTGQYPDTFDTILTGKQHTAQKTTDISHILNLGILCQPVCDGQITVKFLRIIFREIGLACGNSPFIGSLIRFHLAHQNLKQCRLCQLIGTDKRHFIFSSQCKCQMIQNHLPVNHLGQIFNLKHFISNLTVGTEIDIRIFPAGRFDVIQLNLLQRTFTGSCLLALGGIGTETADKFL